MSRLDTKFRRLLELRQASSLAKKAADEASAELKLYTEELFSELEDLGQSSGTFDLGDPHGKVRVHRRETKHARIVDKQALIESVRAEGLEDELLRPEPRKKVLNELIRTRTENGQPLPDGVDFYVDRGLTVTRLNN